MNQCPQRRFTTTQLTCSPHQPDHSVICYCSILERQIVKLTERATRWLGVTVKEQRIFELDLEQYLDIAASSSLDQSLQLLLVNHVRSRNLGWFCGSTASCTTTLIQTRKYILNILSFRYLLDRWALCCWYYYFSRPLIPCWAFWSKFILPQLIRAFSLRQIYTCNFSISYLHAVVSFTPCGRIRK